MGDWSLLSIARDADSKTGISISFDFIRDLSSPLTWGKGRGISQGFYALQENCVGKWQLQVPNKVLVGLNHISSAQGFQAIQSFQLECETRSAWLPAGILPVWLMALGRAMQEEKGELCISKSTPGPAVAC